MANDQNASGPSVNALPSRLEKEVARLKRLLEPLGTSRLVQDALNAQAEVERLRTLIPSGLEQMSTSRVLDDALKAHETAEKISMAFPVAPKMPHLSLLPMPTAEEAHEFQAAERMLRRLSEAIIAWRSALPKESQPSVQALLNDGRAIEVVNLSVESFHGIRIEGRLNGAPCLLLAHQSTIQLLCAVVPAEPPRQPIGFYWPDGSHSNA